MMIFDDDDFFIMMIFFSSFDFCYFLYPVVWSIFILAVNGGQLFSENEWCKLWKTFDVG
jgi:hypothetical protein